MSMARLVITAVVLEGRTKSEVARDYGVSRRWVQKLVARYAQEGEAAFEPHSRRPRRNPGRTAVELEDEIVILRKALAEEGLDAGAQTIAYHLGQRHGSAPATSTIWRVPSRRGFVTPQPHKRPKSSLIRFAAEQPNERWQADTTHWKMKTGDAEILNVIDDHSRLVVGSFARTTFRAADVVSCLHVATERYGIPASVLTDNAAIFTGTSRRGGFVAFERELAALGVRLRHPRPYHPQTCGKVERFHQTLKRYLARQRRARTIAELQAQLDRFGEIYNTRRPHRALGRRTPAEAYGARPKAAPLPGQAMPEHFRVRHDVVDKAGRITLRHNSRLHHIGLGRGLAGTRVLLLVHELDVRVVTEDGELLRELTLDPTRDYQRLQE